MPSLRIVLEADGAFPEMAGKRIHEVNDFAVTALEGGTKSGLPSVAFIIELPDGAYVFAQTTMRLFFTAADAFKAKYGDPRKDAEGVA